jgi:uncharacterized membrane protein YhhN
MPVKDRVINWIAPQGAKSALAGALALVGVAAVFGVSTVGDSLDSSVQTWAFAAGGVLFFVGMAWGAHLQYSLEEREKRIYYRASYMSLMTLLVTYLTLAFGLREDIITLSPMEVLSTVFGVVFGTFFLAQWGYRWVM